jgi:hypothetical protein
MVTGLPRRISALLAFNLFVHESIDKTLEVCDLQPEECHQLAPEKSMLSIRQAAPTMHVPVERVDFCNRAEPGYPVPGLPKVIPLDPVSVL